MEIYIYDLGLLKVLSAISLVNYHHIVDESQYTDCDDFPIGTCIMMQTNSGIGHIPTNNERLAVFTFGSSTASMEKYTKFQVCFGSNGGHYTRGYGSSGWGSWT